MNRLIIIGNGFDLAHGIRTSFNDFMGDYFVRVIKSFITNYAYEDPLIQIKVLHFEYWEINNLLGNPIQTLIDETNVFQVIEKIRHSKNFEFKFISLLLERIYSRCSNLLWVDIEIEYFNILLATKHGYKDSNQFEAIRIVNDQLEFLKRELINYLDAQEKSFTNIFDRNEIIGCFCEEIKYSELATGNVVEDQLPEKLYFLNFNYTNTFEEYYRICKEIIPSDFNYIHGNLSGSHGKPIFGFGDELDKKYLEFENEKNNELFKHIKSFEYLQNKNYYLLTRFIESNLYQVHIYGHSCGLSDRTMLSEIFEHENCKSIKIYFYKKDKERNDFTEKTYEISRHFKNKTTLRKRLVSFDRSREMPQPPHSG